MKKMNIAGNEDQQREASDTSKSKIQRLLGQFPFLRRGSDLGTGDSDRWFAQQAIAVRKFISASQGQILLADSVYRGDQTPHQVLHTKCQNSFLVSLSDIIEEGSEKVCPYCNPPRDLRRFGSLSAIQKHVLDLSESASYFLGQNPLGLIQDKYWYYCLLHKKPYQAQFERFLREAGDSNGCPICFGNRLRLNSHLLK